MRINTTLDQLPTMEAVDVLATYIRTVEHRLSDSDAEQIAYDTLEEWLKAKIRELAQDLRDEEAFRNNEYQDLKDALAVAARRAVYRKRMSLADREAARVQTT